MPPEIEPVLSRAAARRAATIYRKQITIMRGGKERTLNVQVTREEGDDGDEILRHHASTTSPTWSSRSARPPGRTSRAASPMRSRTR